MPFLLVFLAQQYKIATPPELKILDGGGKRQSLHELDWTKWDSYALGYCAMEILADVHPAPPDSGGGKRPWWCQGEAVDPASLQSKLDQVWQPMGKVVDGAIVHVLVRLLQADPTKRCSLWDAHRLLEGAKCA